MKTLVLDFETFFDAEYSLKKMPTLLYIRDPRFLVHGAAIKVEGQPTEWVTRDALPGYFAAVPWSETRVVGHNTLFDFTILHEKYGVSPAQRVDTLGLCRALLPQDLDFDLGTIAPLLGLGEKGDDLAATKGVRDLPPELEAKLAAYACQDAELEYGIYSLLWPELPEFEREVMDLVLEMSTEGILRFDGALAGTAKAEIVERRRQLVEAAGVSETALRSRTQFPELLRARGVEPPTKVSPRTGLITYAFSKQDPEFVQLRDNPDVAALVEARLAVSSNNALKRIDNLIAITGFEPRTLPVQLNVSGAHTHRLSGGGGINMQNLNRGSALRMAIHVLDGYVLIIADASQIELRVNMWFSGQRNVLDLLSTGEYVYEVDHIEWKGGDVYRKEAAAQFHVLEDDVSKPQRQFGKVVQLGCLAENTRVLVFDATMAAPSLKPIQSITVHDLIWDGIEWINHQGLLEQGSKQVLSLDGAWMTPDHLVLSPEGWTPAQCLAPGGASLYRALEIGSRNLPLPATSWASAAELSVSPCSVVVADQNTTWHRKISVTENLLGAIRALKSKLAIGSSVTGATLISFLTSSTEHGSSTGFQRASTDATTRATRASPIMADVGYTSTTIGEVIEDNSSRTLSRLKDGMCRLMSLIEWTLTKAMSRVTSASSIDPPTYETGEQFSNSSPRSNGSVRTMQTYDLALAGPRNRFTIQTDNGYLLVHNCGFGMGPPKFRATCAIGPMGNPPILISEERSVEVINTYRMNHPFVKASWDLLGHQLVPMMMRTDCDYTHKCLVFKHEAIELPNGLRLQYPGLTVDDEGQFTWGINGMTHRIYGGITQENIVQALAGIKNKEDMLAIKKALGRHARVAHQVHDEIITVCKEQDAPEFIKIVAEIMSQSPSWAPDLPVRCEAHFDRSYSK